MLKKHLYHVIVILCCFFAVPGSGYADENESSEPPISMNEEVLKIPADSENPAMLTVTLLRPNGSGPFPLAVMNHGSSTNREKNQNHRYYRTYSAYYFLSRGYAVVLPMMRGYGGSEGKQNLNGCNQEEVGNRNAKDIAAVISYMSAQSDIDSSRIVMAGQSFGGFNTLAYGAGGDVKVKGLINFAGGGIISNCSSTLTALEKAAGHYGAKTTIPSLWFYGDNDSKFPPEISRAMYNSYTAAGGQAELVAYGRFMEDSHEMLGFPEGFKIWMPKVDAFLSKLGLPSGNVNPAYLPMDFPAPTNFAKIDDVDAVPYLNDQGRKTYKQFLEKKMPRVFVVTNRGGNISFNGGFDPLGRAMAACKKHNMPCEVYAVDDYVVWTPPNTQALAQFPPSNFAELDDIDAVPYLNDKGKDNYQKYLSAPKPKVFVISAKGSAGSFVGGPDPLGRAMGSCQKQNLKCEVYAVDDQVVWKPSSNSSLQ